MLSFHGKTEIKEQLLAQLKAHALADEIVKGKYWANGKGCAVGCTIYSSDHTLYEKKYGIPRILARLEDRIFENIPNQLAKKFPIDFISAIPVGVDLTNVWRHFMIWNLENTEYGVINFLKIEDHKNIVINIINLYKRSLTEKVKKEEWIAAATEAADADADAYAYAVDAASYAVDAASGAYGFISSVPSASNVRRKNHYIAQSKYLIKFLKEAK